MGKIVKKTLIFDTKLYFLFFFFAPIQGANVTKSKESDRMSGNVYMCIWVRGAFAANCSDSFLPYLHLP